ncbi:hypothetical protein [Sphingopyxis lindanitolerans]|uniref:hypothetical protein n=1 Tax=Sphingopyxis lindanitolerans TaxID=2054227 RepID=UPI001304AB02|nr:hypothetical protein [Sphingopyxis lindanitolerans]
MLDTNNAHRRRDMNDVEKARNRLLIALFVDSHRPERRHLSREELQTEYFLTLDTPLFNSLAKELREAGLIKTYCRGNY